MGFLIAQLIIYALMLIFAIFMIRQSISLSYENRISNYSLSPLEDKELSFFDRLLYSYRLFIINLRKTFKKSSILNKKAKKYERFIIYTNNNDEKAEEIDFIINKVVIGILFVLLTLFSAIMQSRIVNIWQIIIDFIIGYYILDIYLYYKNRIYKKRIRNDLLRSVIIMNNGFKSGKSTMQTLKMASHDLPEPIRSEYYKMYQEMKYGLSIDNVFDRFSKRIELEEIKYISSSLSVLNKTGGNIIKVFDSIEKTLFNKKKLEEELKNLTASSNLVVKLLMVIPPVFILIVFILSPTYFNPFFENSLGILLLGLIITMFIIYIWLLRKIIKVKV